MEPLNEQQQAEYDERLKNYVATGSFANQSVRGLRRLVKDNKVDTKAAFAEGINERQLPFLEIELKAAGLIVDKPKTAQQQAEPAFPYKAIWRNQDHDQPVVVVGKAGDQDGREYRSVEGSDTAIPLDEIAPAEEGAPAERITAPLAEE